MIEHLKQFNDAESYKDYIFSTDAAFPNVSYVGETDKVYYNPNRINQAGDIIYLSNNKLYVIKKELYSSSLGAAQAVVVVPSNHTPDGTIRVMSLKGMRYDNPTSGGSDQGMYWGGYGVDLSGLTNYDLVPTTSNNGSTTVGASSWSRLPSNSTNGYFTGNTCYTDPGTRYYNTSEAMCPSPYLKDNLQNPAYIENSSGSVLNGRNACADFNGKLNTAIICSAATGQSDWMTASAITNESGATYYPAACCCARYGTDGITSGNWYLPACGELGYIMPRFMEIQNGLSKAGGVLLGTSNYYWSSSEYSSNHARYVSTANGNVNGNYKYGNSYVRAFAALPLSSLSF